MSNPFELFVNQYANKSDDYEVWGGADRPESVLTLGFLRMVAENFGKLDTA